MNTRKKILFIHHGKGLGGAPLSLLYLIQSLDQTRYQPVVLFLYQSEIIDLYRAKGIEVIGPTNTMDFPHTKIWWFRWYHLPYLVKALQSTIQTRLFTARHWLEQIKPDLVHLNTSSLIAWAIVARRIKIPVVWHIREPLADGYLGFRKWLVRSIVNRYANAIIPICNNDAKPWKTSPKTSVIYNAVDGGRFNLQADAATFCQTYKIPANQPTVLFVGGLSQEKGTLPILTIMQLVKAHVPNAQLIIAGQGDFTSTTGFKRFLPGALYKKKVKQAITNLGSSVYLLGPIHEIPAAMAASSVVVFPATVGHFARPVIEAGFMKKPVVASNLAPLDELIEHEKTGFLLDPYDSNAWAKTLTKLLTNPALCTTIGESAHALCTQQFNLADHAKRVQAVYAKLFAKEKHANTTKP